MFPLKFLLMLPFFPGKLFVCYAFILAGISKVKPLLQPAASNLSGAAI